MDVPIYSVEDNSQADMRLCNDNTKRPNLQDTQLAASEIYAFCH